MSMSTNLIRATTEMLVLALLKDSSCHGYELIKQGHRASTGSIRWAEGTLYPLLKRLGAKGLVTARWSGPRVGRRRKVYSLTMKGRRELAMRSAEWAAFATGAAAMLSG